jgi:hypothetical protein
MSKATQFQVKLGGEWTDYSKQEDRILKRAFLAGFPNARYSFRGQKYECNFAKMSQRNVTSGKAREMRPPRNWKPPAAPVCKPGPTICVKGPAGTAGSTMQVAHPKAKGQFIPVQVPATAKAGQVMLVPVPEVRPTTETAPAATPAPEATAPTAAGKKSGWSTGAKVAGVAAVGGLAVAGVVLGEHIAEEGWDATMADLGDVATDVGEGIGDGAEAAVDWVGDAADTVGDFVTDLF